MWFPGVRFALSRRESEPRSWPGAGPRSDQDQRHRPGSPTGHRTQPEASEGEREHYFRHGGQGPTFQSVGVKRIDGRKLGRDPSPTDSWLVTPAQHSRRYG